MKVVNKYTLYPSVVLDLTLNHRILAAQVEQDGPVIWVEEEVNQAKAPVKLAMICTGQPHNLTKYISTIQLRNQEFHVYEICL